MYKEQMMKRSYKSRTLVSGKVLKTGQRKKCMQKGKMEQYSKYLPQIVYALLLLMVIVIPYVLRDRLSWPWIAWTILGVCIVGVLATYARAIYHGFIEP